MSRFVNLRKYLPFKEAIKIYWLLKTGKFQKLQVSKLAHPFSLRSNPYDYAAFEEVILKEMYKVPLPFVPKTIIDAGGNIGLTAAYFATLYPQASIISLEPDKENFFYLQKNTAAYQNVVALNCGLWMRSSNLIVKDLGFGNNGFVVEEVDTQVSDAIQAVSPADLMQSNGWFAIDLLKMDVEGSEKEIFSENYEAWLPRTRVLIVEVHDRLKKGCSKAIFHAINQYNFSLQIAGENLVFMNEDLVS